MEYFCIHYFGTYAYYRFVIGLKLLTNKLLVQDLCTSILPTVRLSSTCL